MIFTTQWHRLKEVPRVIETVISLWTKKEKEEALWPVGVRKQIQCDGRSALNTVSVCSVDNSKYQTSVLRANTSPCVTAFTLLFAWYCLPTGYIHSFIEIKTCNSILCSQAVFLLCYHLTQCSMDPSKWWRKRGFRKRQRLWGNDNAINMNLCICMRLFHFQRCLSLIF